MGLGFKTPKEAIEGKQPELTLLAYPSCSCSGSGLWLSNLSPHDIAGMLHSQH